MRPTIGPAGAGIIWLFLMWNQAAPAAPDLTTLPPVTDAILEKPDPSDWLMWRRTHDSQGFSPLDQITTENVARLEQVWSRKMVEGGMQEGTPLVYKGALFMPNPNDVIEALDAATGEVLWEHRRALPEDLADFIGAPGTNRNLAIFDRYIIDTSNDDFIFALDAATGKTAWETRILDYKEQPAQQSSGPIIVRGMAISGRGCFPQGGPTACVITAHDALTGKEVWRFHNIQRPGEGKDTWGGVPYEDRWHVGAWMMPSYDPALDLIYMGTSVSAPGPKFLLGGNDQEHLYHNSTLALRPASGELAWHYQHLIDHWDLDHPFERILVDTAVAPDPEAVTWINPRIKPGERRKVLSGIPGKNGVIYTLDRETGEFLWARPTVRQNVLGHIDGATGKATVNPEALFTASGQKHLICPSNCGGKMWLAGSYNPATNLMYHPLQNTCMNAEVTIDKRDKEALYGVKSSTIIAPGVEELGTLQAISLETGRTAWIHSQRAAMTSVVATGGGLIFGGDAAGRFRAFDAASGAVRWETDLGAPVTGYPVSFAVNGRQYVAVSTGYSVTTMCLLRLTPEVKPGDEPRLFVFALPE